MLHGKMLASRIEFDVEGKMKTCSICGKEKADSEFHKNPTCRDGLATYCKPCQNEKARKWRAENPDKIKESQRKTDIKGKDRKRKWREANAQKCKESCKRWKARNAKHVRDYSEKYRSGNPEKIKARNTVNHAIESGKIKRHPCSVCGSTENLDAHHEDYSKPLNVVWLCRTHHARLHKGKPNPPA